MPEQPSPVINELFDEGFRKLLDGIKKPGRKLSIIDLLMASTLNRRELYQLNIYRQQMLDQLNYKATLKKAQILQRQLERQFAIAGEFHRCRQHSESDCVARAALSDPERLKLAKKVKVSRGVDSLPKKLIDGLMTWNGPRLLGLRMKNELDSVLLGPATPVATIINQANPILGLGSLIYIPRMLRHGYNVIKHLFRGNVDYLYRHSFDFANDSIWFATGLVTFGISNKLYFVSLSTILGLGGSYLTAGLYGFDALNTVWRSYQLRRSYRFTQKILNQYERHICHEVKAVNSSWQPIKAGRLRGMTSSLKTLQRSVTNYKQYRDKANKAKTCIALGLFVGMLTTLAGPAGIVAGSSIVLLFCYLKHRVDNYWLPRAEVSLSPNAPQLLYNALLQFTEQQIEHLQKIFRRLTLKQCNSAGEIMRGVGLSYDAIRCRDKILAFMRARRVLLSSNMEDNHAGCEELPVLIAKVYDASRLSRRNQGEPASLKKLRKLLKPFAATAWSRTDVSARRGCHAAVKKKITALNQSSGQTLKKWFLRKGGLFVVSENERYYAEQSRKKYNEEYEQHLGLIPANDYVF